MSTVAKIFVVLNLVLAVAFLGAAATFLGYVDTYRGKYEKEADEHRADQATDAGKIAKAEADKGVAVRQANEANDARTKAEADNARLMAFNALMKEQYDTQSAALKKATEASGVSATTVKELQGLADEYRKARDEGYTKLTAITTERDNAVREANEKQLALDNETIQKNEMAAQLQKTQSDLERIRFECEWWQRRHPGEGAGSEQPAQNAKVLRADNDANLYAISLGREDGVQVGFRYTVYRGSQYVATIEVTQVDAKVSVGRSIKDLQKSPIQAGDNAMSR